jgi:hypothetical protein
MTTKQKKRLGKAISRRTKKVKKSVWRNIFVKTGFLK